MDISADTIAAVSTATGPAGLAVIRVSGSLAVDIAGRIFQSHAGPVSAWQPGVFHRGRIHDPSSRDSHHLDEAILLLFRAPHSYTREDVVEIQCHGGRPTAARILALLTRQGARLAEPGEFTRRAFLNGRLDLLQAEAVADLVAAQSARSAKAALAQLDGSLSSCVAGICGPVVDAIAGLEASLDFPEDDIPDRVIVDARSAVSAASVECRTLLATSKQGRILREGAKVAIAGQPNAGKSTLLNRLLQTDRAIVTPVPGTTRDLIEEQIILEGLPVRLIDTAGLRATSCAVESIGVQRAESAIRDADVVVYMIDTSSPATPDLSAHLAMCRPDRTIILLNKNDLPPAFGSSSLPPGLPALSVSLLADNNIPAIRAAILEKLPFIDPDSDTITISTRHQTCLQSALNELNAASECLDSRVPGFEVLAVSHLRSALESMQTFTGEQYDNRILDAVFSRFCIGK